jgi:hypothetical protein
MDYFAGSLNDSHLHHIIVVIDPQKGEAFDIPGTGNESIVFTKAADVGKFVAASLQLEKWPTISGMVGERTTYNEVIRKLEKVQGEYTYGSHGCSGF